MDIKPSGKITVGPCQVEFGRLVSSIKNRYLPEAIPFLSNWLDENHRKIRGSSHP